MTAPQGNSNSGNWPQPAQITAAFLLGIGAALLSVRLVADPVRPMEFRSATFDLNRASRSELLQLPGVGPSLADRIVAVRDASGGFESSDQLRAVPGFGPARLERIQPLVKTVKAPVNSAPHAIGPIDINSASSADLQTLPGIGPKLAQRMIDERDKSPFTSIDDLRRVPGVGPKTIEKLRPFARVQR